MCGIKICILSESDESASVFESEAEAYSLKDAEQDIDDELAHLAG